MIKPTYIDLNKNQIIFIIGFILFYLIGFILDISISFIAFKYFDLIHLELNLAVVESWFSNTLHILTLHFILIKVGRSYLIIVLLILLEKGYQRKNFLLRLISCMIIFLPIGLFLFNTIIHYFQFIAWTAHLLKITIQTNTYYLIFFSIYLIFYVIFFKLLTKYFLIKTTKQPIPDVINE